MALPVAKNRPYSRCVPSGGLCLDAYVRLPVREVATVSTFLDTYAPHWREPDAWACQDYLLRLSLGLGHRPLPDEANLYLTDKVWPLAAGLDYVIVSFDSLGEGIVLGLSVPERSDKAQAEAERRLTEMQVLLSTGPGFWGGEHPPPKTEQQWHDALVYYQKHNSG